MQSILAQSGPTESGPVQHIPVQPVSILGYLIWYSPVQFGPSQSSLIKLSSVLFSLVSTLVHHHVKQHLMKFRDRENTMGVLELMGGWECKSARCRGGGQILLFSLLFPSFVPYEPWESVRTAKAGVPVVLCLCREKSWENFRNSSEFLRIQLPPTFSRTCWENAENLNVSICFY